MDTIKQLAELATDNAEGADWYDQAQRDICTVCEAAGWDCERFTGILAVTSPRVSVARNLRITLHYMQCGDYLDNVMSNIRASVTKYLDTGEITGPKTYPFYRALLGDADAVVLDVHMADLFCIDQKHFSKPAVRNEYAGVVRDVAQLAAMSPRDCQAALWAGQLRRRGRRPQRLNLLLERSNQLAYGSFPTSGYIEQRGCADGSFQVSLF